jgi:FAD/FMN-containing dehydrogenase
VTGDAFGAIVGAEHVVLDAERLGVLSRDLSQEASAVACVAVAPGSVAELSAVVAEAGRQGRAVVARGAAWSYTLAHTPASAETVLIDMRRMNAIRSISVDDLYVTVEAGCTWERLHLALRERGVRLPFFGPLSGRTSTVGGAVSQNATFFGSGRYGTAADSVLGLEVVLADGSVVRTGSGAHRSGTPFARTFGPDLTGPFLADSGALGVKAAVTFALIPAPALTVGASFAFADLRTLVAVMGDLARTRLAAELYGFGGLYHELLAAMGFGFLREPAWTLHFAVDGVDEATADATLGALRRMVGGRGVELPGSVPIAMRADPFGATRAMFAATEKAVHLPVHALLPFSRAGAAIDLYERFARERAPLLREHGVGTWALPAAAGKDFLFELTVFYPEASGDAGREVALALRREAAELFDPLGAVHMQLGKFYGYEPVIEEPTFALLQSLKAAVDPEGRINPGALGLA